MAEDIKAEENINEPPPRKANARDMAKEQTTKKGFQLPSMNNKEGIDLKKLIIVSAVVSFLMILVMSMAGLGSWVTPKVLDAKLQTYSKTITELTSVTEKKQATIDSAIQGIPKQVTDTVNASLNQVNTNINNLSNNVNSVKESNSAISAKNNELSSQISSNAQKVDSISSKVVSAESQISTLSTKITELQTENTSLKSRITALENKQSIVNTTPANSITATVKTSNNIIYAQSNTVAQGWFQVKLVNNSSVEIDDIVLDAMIQISPGYSITGTSPSTFNLSGGNTTWQYQGAQFVMDFVNWQYPLTLSANETKTLTLTYTITGTGTNFMSYTSGIPYTVEVNVL